MHQDHFKKYPVEVACGVFKDLTLLQVITPPDNKLILNIVRKISKYIKFLS